ncbi:MAG: ferrous iron transport protein B [Chitinophagaceae bacterium]|nr:ferrous iron transport protein B [Chitinophagaceae bacterium]
MKRKFNIAITGNPNAGKSSLFNALTGLNQRVGNFPGVTVDKKSGRCILEKNTEVNIIDLPGTYSLYPKSADELVTYDVLFDTDETVKIDLIVVLVDASNLKRNLLFCSQIIDLKKPVVVALTMMDLANKKGIGIDVNKLAIELGVPVVALNPRKNKGINELKKNIYYTLTEKNNFIPQYFIDLSSLSEVPKAIFSSYIKDENEYVSMHFAASYDELSFFDNEKKAQIKKEFEQRNFSVQKMQAEEILMRYAKIKKIMKTAVAEENPLRKEIWSEKADNILLHPVWGYLILFSILFLLFQSIFWLAQYPMEWIDSGFSVIINLFKANLPDTFLSNLFTEGILAGINGVVIFIPQIMILFALITVLEDSGYMSRISFLSDRLMRRVGLNGKSVMPLISSMACAVPAIMAARTIENKKERLITILITPLMSCSARLPVYTILISLVIPNKYILGIFNLQGLVMMALYLSGFVMALLVASVINKFLKFKNKSIFLMELPIYRPPRWGNILITMSQKAKIFVFDAGKIILIISIFLWIISSYGPIKKDTSVNYFAKTTLENSYAGHIGKSIESAIKPLGFDWKIGIALITSFAAREVFVGTMATLYSVDEEDNKTLRQKMSAAKWENGKDVYTLSSGISLMLFYAFAMQCMSTLAIVKRETKSWFYPILQFVLFSSLAYLCSLMVYQIMN